MPHIETELKYLLEKESFHSLYRLLKRKGSKSHLTRQVNFYFAPTTNIATQPLSSTRIRFVEGRWELTCKVPIIGSDTSMVQNCYEYNVDINRDTAMNYMNYGLSMLTQKELFGDLFQTHGIPLVDLFCYGHLRTARFAFSVEKDLSPLLLDANAYLGVLDYEIEWELKQIEIADTLLQSMFHELGIQPVDKGRPKVKRFFDRLTNLGLLKAKHPTIRSRY